MSQKDKMINLKKSYGWISLVCSKLWKHWDYKTCRICILTRISTCVVSLSYLLKKAWHLNISLCHIRPIITALFHLNIKSLYDYLTHFMSLYYPLSFSDVFRNYRTRPIAWNWLNFHSPHVEMGHKISDLKIFSNIRKKHF